MFYAIGKTKNKKALSTKEKIYVMNKEYDELKEEMDEILEKQDDLEMDIEDLEDDVRDAQYESRRLSRLIEKLEIKFVNLKPTQEQEEIYIPEFNPNQLTLF